MDLTPASSVRSWLLDVGFTADGVLARLGPAGFAALGRGLQLPVRRALATRPAQAPALDALVVLLLLGGEVAASDLPAGRVAQLEQLGLVRREGPGVQPLLEVRPYGEPDTDWYVVSDLGAPRSPDHVLGAGGASLTLARITPRREVARVLDLGCGAGIQALHASRHAEQVVATDINPRALQLTALTAALSGLPPHRLDLRRGSLFDPVRGEQFDLIVANPPFVISPEHRFTYRDAGLPGDELSRRVVRRAVRHLAPGGVAVLLANWLHVEGQAWGDRVRGWVQDGDADAWIVQREALPVADYAAAWLRDAGVAEGAELDAGLEPWLDSFAALAAEQVGFGWVVLVAPEHPRPGRRDRWLLLEDLSHSPRLPDGSEVLELLAGCAAAATLSAPDVLAAPVRLRPGTTVRTTSLVHESGESGGPVELGRTGVLGPGGWRPAPSVSPALLAALRADPAQPLGERLDGVAAAAGLDPLDLLGPALTGVLELVRHGLVSTDGRPRARSLR